MERYQRYAIFYTLPDGPLLNVCAPWLGWDSRAGRAVRHMDIPDLDIETLTATPRKYGFHGTLKAPFELAPGSDEAALRAGVAAFAARHAPAPIEGLDLADLHGFLALRPTGEAGALKTLASAIVRELDPYRAPLSDSYIARRRASGLTARQDQQMLDWGYPYIFDDFRFHLTMTGRLKPASASAVRARLWPLLAPVIPDGLSIDAISLMGEAQDGMFYELDRASLSG